MLDYVRKRKLKFALFFAACAVALVLWGAFLAREDISEAIVGASGYFRKCVGMLEGVPLAYYALAIFLLPIFFLPVSPVFFLASARMPEYSYPEVLAVCWLGVAANIIASYFISRKFGMIIRRIFARKGINIPDFPPSAHYEFVFLMRMIPGNPLTVQNYALGLANVSFAKYVLVSLPIQFVQIAAYVYFGEGVFEGGLSKIFLGSGILFTLAAIARMLEKRYGYKLKGGKNGVSGQE